MCANVDTTRIAGMQLVLGEIVEKGGGTSLVLSVFSGIFR